MYPELMLKQEYKHKPVCKNLVLKSVKGVVTQDFRFSMNIKVLEK